MYRRNVEGMPWQSSAFIRTNDGGLAMTAESIAGFNMNKNERKYHHTDLGEVLISILGWKIKV